MEYTISIKINLVGVPFKDDSENISDPFLDDRMSRSLFYPHHLYILSKHS